MSKPKTVSAQAEHPQVQQSTPPSAGGNFSFSAMLGAAFACAVVSGLIAGAAHYRDIVQVTAAIIGAAIYLISDRKA